jgi:hypothetical protein
MPYPPEERILGTAKDRKWNRAGKDIRRLAGNISRQGKRSNLLPVSLLLDPDDPSIVLKRGKKPVLFPEKSYEKQGFFPNVIFSNGLIQKDDLKLFIYYGACDKNVCVAETSIDERLSTI